MTEKYDPEKRHEYCKDKNCGLTLLYDGTCKVCLSFVTKMERIIRPDVEIRFTPFGKVVSSFVN